MARQDQTVKGLLVLHGILTLLDPPFHPLLLPANRRSWPNAGDRPEDQGSGVRVGPGAPRAFPFDSNARPSGVSLVKHREGNDHHPVQAAGRGCLSHVPDGADQAVLRAVGGQAPRKSIFL